MARAFRITIIFLVFCFALPVLSAAETDAIVRTFNSKSQPDPDATREEWKTASGEDLKLHQINPEYGDSLMVPVKFPEVSLIWRGSRDDPRRVVVFNRLGDEPAMVFNTLKYQVYVPGTGLPSEIRIQSRLLLKNKDGFWFEALGKQFAGYGSGGKRIWKPATALQPGWNTLRVDLSDQSTDLRPRGHQMRWSRFFLAQVVAIGFSFHGDKDFRNALFVDNITVYKEKDDDFPPLKIINFKPSAEKANRYEKTEMEFTVNRPLLNPFRQKEIAIDGYFTPPGGGEPVVVPAFYYQPYRRNRGSDKPGEEAADEYVPYGAGVFKLRFCPREAGKYEYVIKVKYRSPISLKEEEITSGKMILQVSDREDRGFIRVSETDRRYFEFENGDYFFPVGHSFRSPTDLRHYNRILKTWFKDQPAPADRGLRVYEDLLPKMKAAGVNTFEVWMASWWLGIEWTGKWKNYHGIGIYNMEHAWKLDALIDLARENDQFIHLVIDNHGKAAQKMPGRDRDGNDNGQHDHEWENSPYSSSRDEEDKNYIRQDGGFLRYSKDLFRDRRARDFYRDKLRYIAARWGWSPTIFGFELWSELDLIGHVKGRQRWLYANATVHDWHKEMATYLKKQSQGNQLVTTHYSGDWTIIDRTMIGFPFIEYIVCDAYHPHKKPLLEMLQETENLATNYNKPFNITEFGGDWNASSREGLDGDLYAGLWWSWTSQSAGTPFYWWFEYIDLVGHYSAYRAFANYIDGEDKRRAPGQPRLHENWPTRIEGEKSGRLAARILGDGKIFYAWLYDPKTLQLLPLDPASRPVYDGIKLICVNAPRAKYSVETWDCWTGKIVDRFGTESDENNFIHLPLPKFTSQIALKIRYAGEAKPLPKKPEISAEETKSPPVPSSEDETEKTKQKQEKLEEIKRAGDTNREMK